LKRKIHEQSDKNPFIYCNCVYMTQRIYENVKSSNKDTPNSVNEHAQTAKIIYYNAKLFINITS